MQNVFDSVAQVPGVTTGICRAHARAPASKKEQNLVKVDGDGSQLALLNFYAVQ